MTVEQRCDWCHELATRITHHERANTGPVMAYWCERHYAEAARGAGESDAAYAERCLRNGTLGT